MKTILRLLICTFLPLTLVSCDEDPFSCTENIDCRGMCLSYGHTDGGYACFENRCRCVTNEAMICEGDHEKDRCQEICDMFYPGKTGACVMAKCECRDADPS